MLRNRRWIEMTLAILILTLTACARGRIVTVQPPAAGLFNYQTLAVSVATALPDDLQEEITMLAAETIKAFRAKGTFPQTRAAGDADAAPGTVVLHATITDIRKVSDSARLFAGAFAGRAQITLDVRLLDGETGNPLAVYTVSAESGATGMSGGTEEAVIRAATELAELVVPRPSR